jgi:selenide,water dikinase
MLAAGAHAATDVTGFGLLGHAGEVAQAGGVRIRIVASRIPVLDLVRDMVAVGIAPGGSRDNAREHERYTDFASGISPEQRLILSDAQTSGGLLIAVAPEQAETLRAGLLAEGALAARIGTIERGEGLVVEG